MAGANEEIAARFFGAIERGDLDAVREIYAPQVEVWHNTTGRTQTRDENLALLTTFASRVADRRYEVRSRDHFEGGFVQRHVLHGRVADGEAIAAEVCLVIYIEEARIVRLFEYLDAGAVAAAFPPRGSTSRAET